MRDARGVEPAHLARADTDGGAVLHIDDGVGLDVLGDLPGELEVGHLGVGRRLLGHHLELDIVEPAIVAALHQHAAGQRLERDAGLLRIGQRAGDQQAEVLLGGDDLLRRVAGRRRDDHFGEDLDDLDRRRLVDLLIERDDAAERRRRIAAMRLGIGVGERRSSCDAAGIGVLDDRDRRHIRVELADQLERRIGVVEIVVAQRLALELRRRRDAGPLLAVASRTPPIDAGSRHSASPRRAGRRKPRYGMSL